MSASFGEISIPFNKQSTGGAKIEEFLMAYNGEGIQHVTFSCDDIYASWDQLKT